MLIAIHRCPCEDTECQARALIGFGETHEALKTSIINHWDGFDSGDDDNLPVTFEVYQSSGTITLQREVSFTEIKVN